MATSVPALAVKSGVPVIGLGAHATWEAACGEIRSISGRSSNKLGTFRIAGRRDRNTSTGIWRLTGLPQQQQLIGPSVHLAAIMRTRGGAGGIIEELAPPSISITGLDSKAEKLASSSSRSGGGGGSGIALARLSLLTVAFLFGTLNVSLRLVYALPNPPAPSVVGLIRGLFTALCFSPSLLRLMLITCRMTRVSEAMSSVSDESREGLWRLWRAAFWLGFWNVAAQGLLTVGLTLTSSSIRASFLAQSSVVITPIISTLGGEKVARSVWAGALIALIGLIIFSTSEGPGARAGADQMDAMGAGDLIVLGCAVCWSKYLNVFGQIADLYDRYRLQAATCGIRLVMYFLWFLAAVLRQRKQEEGLLHAIGELWGGWRDTKAWAMLIFSAVGSGAMAGVLQQKGQASLSSSESNVLLSSEPIFACLCAWIVLGESLSPRESVGGFIIVLAALVASGTFTAGRYEKN